MNKHINNMTRKEFLQVPSREFVKNIGKFDSLVILPGNIKDMHDSGYRLMDFVAVLAGKPLCRLSGCSDVIHLDGIGGFGFRKYEGIFKPINIKGWSMDCLPKSGLIHIFCPPYKLICGEAISSFEIYAIENKS